MLNEEKLLNKIREIRKYKSFFHYYIFDYEPKEEISIREYIKNQVESEENIKVFDLYDLMIDLLETEGYLEDCFEMEKNDGMNYLVESVNDLFRMNDDNNYFVEYIEKNTPENSAVLLTGVGKVKGMISVSKIINNLEKIYFKQPLILFFPEKISRRKVTEDLDSKKLYRGILLEV